jgi:transglutaminase-like putative cysteine protease
MLYEILLRTKCAYTSAATGRQTLRLMPADMRDGQRLIAGSIDIRPAPSERVDRYDFFGNRTTDVLFARPVEKVEFTVRARVDRFAQPPTADKSSPRDQLRCDLAAVQNLNASSPHHFLDASPMVRPSPAVRSYACEATRDETTTQGIVNALNIALNRDMKYDGEATTVETPFEEAFAKRRGVCQDFAHIMIAALRELGIPAGYVSGFLRTEPPAGKPRLEGADAMHAWVQAWCGLEAGWIEFDPTNRMLAGPDHVVAGRGRDYTDVAPVRGVMRTAGAQDISQSVDVLPLG